MGLFRRQKDLLSQQREELGLDRPFESPQPTYGSSPADSRTEPVEPPDFHEAEVVTPDDEQPRFEPLHSRGGGFTVTSRRSKSGWGRMTSVPRVFFFATVATLWTLTRAGLAPGAALIAGVLVGVVAAYFVGRSRVSFSTTRGTGRPAAWPRPNQPPEDPSEPPTV